MLSGMLYAVLFGGVLLGQTGECRTPLGVPCYTVKMRTTSWELFKSGITDIKRSMFHTFEAVRNDGSVSKGDLDPPRKLLNREVLLRTANQRLSVQAAKREFTVFNPDPYYDRNTRRSEPSDRMCAGAIGHYGSAPPVYTYAGTDRVAGVPVVVYRKTGMSWRWMHEVAMAPSLDCLALRTIHRNIPDLWGDDQANINIMEAVSVMLGQPPPELFAIPQGYKAAPLEEPSKILDSLAKYPQVFMHR